jgi:hypothetical protein
MTYEEVESEVEPEIWVIIQVDGKRNKREICGNNFHDIRKDRAGR